MSTHLLIAAMYLEDLPQGRKLILAAIADSADEHTLEAAPGLPKLRAWSGLSKSAALAQVKALEDSGIVQRIEAGRLGRRAVYRVFPAGVPAIPHPDEVRARYDTQPVHNPPKEGPASRTLGSCLTPSRVLPAGPLQSSTSVSIGATPSEPVDKRPTPSAPSTGFPGSRATAEDERGIRNRARGAHNQPCPFHADQTVPCGRCSWQAEQDRQRDPDAPARAIAAAREAIRQQQLADTTDNTEETRSA